MAPKYTDVTNSAASSAGGAWLVVQKPKRTPWRMTDSRLHFLHAGRGPW